MEWVNNGANVPIKSWCKEIEETAMVQAVNLANHPCVFKHIALMPDCHCGYGMPIGGVVALDSAICPNAVGVDIGCGMSTVQTSIKASSLSEQKIKEIMGLIRDKIPMGEGKCHKEEQTCSIFEDKLSTLMKSTKATWLEPDRIQLDKQNLGTLGGGNHFIELQTDENDSMWVMIHSGSRNLGHRICSYYNKIAEEQNALWHSNPTKDLAFLPMKSSGGIEYMYAMSIAMDYAFENRAIMMHTIIDILRDMFPDYIFHNPINVHHNYAAFENHFDRNVVVHRKGATSAKKGEMGIIPGSMGTASYIVRGLGNKESFMSCSHGAGRAMSRTDACLNISEEDATKAMDGVVFGRWGIVKRGRAKGKADVSESPLAYKDIDVVMDSQKDLVEIVAKLKPIGAMKG